MPLYEVAIVLNPTKEDRDEGKLEELLMKPSAVIAKDEQTAAIKAVTDAGSAVDFNNARVQVIVRPFN